MEKKKWVKLAGFAMVFLLSLFLCVGCADNSAEDCDEVTFIDFGRESASSRGIESWNENLYPPESLYWTYKATKIRGNYTTGQTSEPKPVVKNGPATGLGTVGPFSVGVWKFELFGYLSCAENATTGELEFSDLVYTGKTGTETDNYITIDKRPEGVTTVQQIIFELSATSFWDFLQGQLAIENLKLTVPEGQRISGTKPASGKTGAEIIIRIWKGVPASDNDPIAESVSVFTTDINAGTVLESGSEVNKLVTPAFIDYGTAGGGIHNKFLENTYNFYIAAMYQDEFTAEQGTASGQAYYYTGTDDENIYDDGYAPIGAIVSYPLAIKAGVKTTISGDINDIQVAEDEYAHDEKLERAVAKILNSTETAARGEDYYDFFTTFSDAVAAYNSADKYKTGVVANPIIVIFDIDDAGEFTPAADVVVKMKPGATGQPNKRFYVRNLTVSGSNAFVFKFGDDSNVKDYRFSAGTGTGATGKIKDFLYSNGVMEITTEGGILTVDSANDTVWHSGTADKIVIEKVKYSATDSNVGYHFGDRNSTTGGNVAGTIELKAGNLTLGGNTSVDTLSVLNTTGVSVCGSDNSFVDKYSVTDGATTVVCKETGSGVAPVLFTESDTDAKSVAKSVFSEIVICDNIFKRTDTIDTGYATEDTKKYFYAVRGTFPVLPAVTVFDTVDPKTDSWNTKADGLGDCYGGLAWENDYVAGTAPDSDGVNLYIQKVNQYEKLKYIESSGRQYIDTGYMVKSNTRVVYNFEITGWSTNNAALFGARSAAHSTDTFVVQRDAGNEKILAEVGNNNLSSAFAATGENTLELDFSKFKLGADEATIGSTGTKTDGTKPLYLFGLNDNGSLGADRMSQRCYSFKVYEKDADGNETLVKDLIPVRTVGEEKVGLLDLVSGTFYENDGSGVFDPCSQATPEYIDYNIHNV